MKKIISVLLLCLIPAFVFSMEYPAKEAEESKEPPASICPVTKIAKDCMSCHVLKRGDDDKIIFGIKELALDAGYEKIPGYLDLIKENDSGPLVAYMEVVAINDMAFKKAAQYLAWHPEIKKLIIDLHSPGGSVMDAWRIVGYIEQMRSRGILIETRCYGMAASAGFILFVAGDPGHRYVNKHAELMTHKVWSFSMFKLSDPDSSEDEANMLKHFQANINRFIAGRTNFTVEQLDDRTYKKDYWMTGAEAIKHGVADHFIR